MAFPTNLDTTSTIPVEAGSTALSTNHVVNHTAMQTAIIALETKVGVDSSAVTTTHDYKLGEITSTDKAVGKTATQTLTNKTLTSPSITGATITTSTVNGVTLTTAGSASNFLAENGTYQAGGVSNASTTVKGIVEAATSAEVTAGTATGGTGAVLVVTPDALAASTPVFNGSGLTNIPKLLNTVTTDVTYSSSTAENTLLSYSVAGGTLSTSNFIRVTMHVTALSVSNAATWTLRFKYGATTLTTKVYTASGGAITNFGGKMEFLLAGAGTTGTQNGSYALNLGTNSYIGSTNATLQMFADSAQGTASIDSTASQTLAITSQHNTSSASDNITVSIIMVEVIR